MTDNVDTVAVRFVIKSSGAGKTSLYSGDRAGGTAKYLIGDFPSVAEAHAWVDRWVVKKAGRIEWSDDTNAVVTYVEHNDGGEA